LLTTDRGYIKQEAPCFGRRDFAESTSVQEIISRKGAKAQRNLLENAAALCAFAGKIAYGELTRKTS
jgi:hypothetical protein